jgi:TatA/E family protein of Tat protein translocase
MGGLSLTHWAIRIGAVLLVFGSVRFPSLMADMAKGIKAFRAHLSDDSTDRHDKP